MAQFEAPSLTNRGELGSEDVKFFYYEIAKFNELETLVELSDKELLKVAKDNGITLKPLKQQTFNSLKYAPAENEIIFTTIKIVSKKKKRKRVCATYQTSLLNHLRNSFSHYRILYQGNFFSMEDKKNKAYTMRGLVDKDKFKKFILELQNHSEKQLLITK